MALNILCSFFYHLLVFVDQNRKLFHLFHGVLISSKYTCSPYYCSSPCFYRSTLSVLVFPGSTFIVRIFPSELSTPGVD